MEYALSLYVILVEKVKLKGDNISSIIAHGFYDSKFDITHPLQLFHNFELKLNRLFRKEDIEINDVFLRFVNPQKLKLRTKIVVIILFLRLYQIPFLNFREQTLHRFSQIQNPGL